MQEHCDRERPRGNTVALWYLLVVVAMAGLLASSCFGGDVSGSRCRCPTLIETAPTIDFVGDGRTPWRVLDSSATGPRPLQVDLQYDAVDERIVQSTVAQRMAEAGFQHEIVNDEDHFVADGWEVYVGGARVRVTIAEPDRDAAETLAPLAEALGTIP